MSTLFSTLVQGLWGEFPAVAPFLVLGLLSIYAILLVRHWRRQSLQLQEQLKEVSKITNEYVPQIESTQLSQKHQQPNTTGPNGDNH